MAGTVCIARPKLDSLFSPKAELLWKDQADADVRIGHAVQPAAEPLRFILVGNELSLRNREVDVIAGNQPRFAYLLRPPPQVGDAVFDSSRRQPFPPPAVKQRPDMFAFERTHLQLPKTGLAQLTSTQCQRTQPIGLGRIASVPVAPAKNAQRIRQFVSSSISSSCFLLRSESKMVSVIANSLVETRFPEGTRAKCSDHLLPQMRRLTYSLWGDLAGYMRENRSSVLGMKYLLRDLKRMEKEAAGQRLAAGTTAYLRERTSGTGSTRDKRGPHPPCPGTTPREGARARPGLAPSL